MLVVRGSGVGLTSGEDSSDVVADGGLPVLRAKRATRTGPGGFRCTGWRARLRPQVPEPPPHSGWGESVRFRRPLPRPTEVPRERASEAELCVCGQDEPGPAVGRFRIPQTGPGPAERLLEQPERVLHVEPSQECLPAPVDVVMAPPVPDHHSQTGLFTPPLGSFATVNRITVPSMIGNGPTWSSHAARRVSRGRSRSQACAVAVPYRSVLVTVTAVASPHVTGSPKTNSPPCLGGRPPCGRQIHGTGTGLRMTRSERSRPSTSTGRSLRR